MTTIAIPLSDYRKNRSRYAREAQEKDVRYVVMVHGRPALEVRSASKEPLYLDTAAYRDESWDEFASPQDLLADLKRHHNAK